MFIPLTKLIYLLNIQSFTDKFIIFLKKNHSIKIKILFSLTTLFPTVIYINVSPYVASVFNRQRLVLYPLTFHTDFS